MKNIFACICKLLLIQVVCYSEEEVFHYFFTNKHVQGCLYLSYGEYMITLITLSAYFDYL